MRDIISDSVSKLSAITDQTPVDWDAFDSVLKGLEDINIYDDHYEDTILSSLIKDGDYYNRGAILVDIVRHFLSCGYDVSANEGLNGGLALHSLCWSSYDRYILDAAKVLMNAGAPVNYRTSDDDPNEEPSGLLGSISWKLSGAWVVDNDFAFANTLEAYYAMTEANIAGKDYNSIDHYFTCIGKPLTSVSAINVGGEPALHDEGDISVYSEPLIMWFEDKPLVISCYTDLVVNPVYADDKKDILTDVTTMFSSLIGATLQEVKYFDATLCYLEFSNGKRLFFSGRNIGDKIDDKKRIGTFGIRDDSKKVDVEQLRIECFSLVNRNSLHEHTSAGNVKEYCADAIALFCDDTAYLLYIRPEKTGRRQLSICPCSKAFLADQTRHYSLKQLIKTTWMYKQNNLYAVRFEFPDKNLYIAATKDKDIGIRLSDKQ